MVAIVALIAGIAPGIAEEHSVLPALSTEDVEAGRQLYRIYCHGCHGADGRGNGPAARGLTVAPRDLTALARSDDGRLDRDAVYAAIEGIDRAPGHRAEDMPVWGFAFRQMDRDAESRGEIRSRILHLVDYLESIQDGTRERR
jgi:mono/diheme cytochrome c family protein